MDTKRLDKSKFFLGKPSVRADVMETALNNGIAHAKELGATFGTLKVSIVLDGEEYSHAKSVGGNIAMDYNPTDEYEDMPGIVGTSYPGYASGKAYQSIRTGKPSEEGSALGFGESNSAGSDYKRFYRLNEDNETIEYAVVTVFSGLSPEQDFTVAQTAMGSAWYVMSCYDDLGQPKESYGSCRNNP